jgi:hypothetical protein
MSLCQSCDGYDGLARAATADPAEVGIEIESPLIHSLSNSIPASYPSYIRPI